MAERLRLRVARTSKLGEDEFMEFDFAALPLSRIGGRGTQVLPKGRKFAEIVPPAIQLVDWDKVPDGVGGVIRPKTGVDAPTAFWLCTACGRMVELAESEPLPEGDCKHEWMPLDV